MFIKLFGTRGSLPIASPNAVKYGGNTTSLRIESVCLPEGLVLAVDAGSGFRPLASEAMSQGMKELVLLHTHWHHDHTQGALIAPPFYIRSLPIRLYGPVERGMGPREVYDAIMRKPLHPVDFAEIADHINCHNIEHPSTKVFVSHSKGGIKLMNMEQFRRLVSKGEQIPFDKRDRYPLDECLVIRMRYTDHPERTITYRFEEYPTGKTFVFLTDEECRAALPQELKTFLSGVDLLIQDVQYSDLMYKTRTAGFGHGTPSYAVEVANSCGIKRVGFTHHDPGSSDSDVENLVQDAQNLLDGNAGQVEIFACADYQVIEL